MTRGSTRPRSSAGRPPIARARARVRGARCSRRGRTRHRTGQAHGTEVEQRHRRHRTGRPREVAADPTGPRPLPYTRGPLSAARRSIAPGGTVTELSFAKKIGDVLKARRCRRPRQKRSTRAGTARRSDEVGAELDRRGDVKPGDLGSIARRTVPTAPPRLVARRCRTPSRGTTRPRAPSRSVTAWSREGQRRGGRHRHPVETRASTPPPRSRSRAPARLRRDVEEGRREEGESRRRHGHICTRRRRSRRPRTRSSQPRRSAFTSRLVDTPSRR